MSEFSFENAGKELQSNSYHILELLQEENLKPDRILTWLSTRLQYQEKEDQLKSFSFILFEVITMLDITDKLYHDIPTNEFIPHIKTLISTLLNAERTLVYIHDKETKELVTQDINDRLTPMRFSDQLGIMGDVFTYQKAQIINNISTDSHIEPHPQDIDGFSIHNILCVPILGNNGVVVGVIEVFNKKDNVEFNDDDSRLLMVICTKLALIISEGDRLQKVNVAHEEENKLKGVIKELTSELHFFPLIKKVLGAVVELLDVDRSTIFLHDNDTNELWSLDGTGDVKEKIRFPSDKGIAGSVFQTKKTIYVSDVYSDSRFNPEFDQKIGYHTQNLLCLPLIHSSGRCIGVIQAINKQEGVFTIMDEKRLEILSEYASIAIENAKLFDSEI